MTQHLHPTVAEVKNRLGLHIDHTGGNCEALGYYPKDVNDFYLWITEDGVCIPSSPTALCEFGVYDPSGDFNWIVQGQDTFQNIIDNRDALIALGQRLFARNESEKTYDTVADALRE